MSNFSDNVSSRSLYQFCFINIEGEKNYEIIKVKKMQQYYIG